MKISSKGRYAVRILAYISLSDKDYVSISEISEKQQIPLKYLEQIVSKLLKANLLASQRGSLGGYKLTKNPEQYSLYEIFKVTGDLPKLAPCLENGNACPNKTKCLTIDCWEGLSSLINEFLQNNTLQDVLNKC